MNKDIFMNPTREYGIKPFWFWNGDMSEVEIENQIKEMSEKGIGGVFICARQGLKIPYLSEEWFNRVKFATETAVRYDIEVWLYDEYPYPSGISGGEVILQHSDAKQNSLVQRFEVVQGFKDFEMELPWAKVISALAAPKDRKSGKYLWNEAIDLIKYIGNYQAEEVFQKTGLTKYNDKRYFTYGPKKRLLWKVPEGEFGILVSMEKEIEDFKYYGTYVDPCSKEAVETFINTTHNRYKETLGDYFGTVVKGMFSDEVGLLGNIPWTTRLRKFFKEKNGYDINECMPALFDEQYENAAKIRYDYYQAIHLLFREAYHERISKWCDENSILYATEVPSMRMTTQLFSHIPGGDSAHEKLGRSLEWILDEYTSNLRANPKLVSSLARQLGRRFAMIECFHSIGWSMTLQDAKWMIDRLAAFGINFYNFHAFFYTIEGLTKHDAPPSQFLQNPYWKHFKHLSDYVGRISYVISESKASTEIAVLDPITTLWTHLGNPFTHFNYGGTSNAEEEKFNTFKRDWVYVCKTLTMNQVDYDHIDAEILADSAVIDGKLMKGDATYSALILPPVSNLEASAWEKIKEFLKGGGKVISLGSLPYEVIDSNTNIKNETREWFGVYKDTQNKEFFKGQTEAYFIPSCGSLVEEQKGEDLLKLLDKVTCKNFSLNFLKGSNKGFLMHNRKMNDGTEIAFISNQEGEICETVLAVKLDERSVSVEELNLESGNVMPIDFKIVNNSCEIPIKFMPYEAHLIKITYNDSEVSYRNHAIEKLNTVNELVLDDSSTWKISADRDNILRFGNFEFTIDTEDKGIDKGWHSFEDDQKWSTVDAKTFIDQCSDFYNDREYKITFNQNFGTPMKLNFKYPMICWYRTKFKVENMPEIAKILMNGSAISGDYIIYINGNALTKDDFKTEFHHDQNDKVCDIYKFLKNGENHLEIRVIVERDWDGVVDPLYITGSFGVVFDNDGTQIIGQEPKSAKIQGAFITGYPHYAGEMSFKRIVKIDKLSYDKALVVRLKDMDNNLHDCLELIVNGQSVGVRPWSPYIWNVNSDVIKIGENEVEIRVNNTLIGMLDGKFFDYDNHKLVDVKEGNYV